MFVDRTELRSPSPRTTPHPLPSPSSLRAEPPRSPRVERELGTDTLAPLPVYGRRRSSVARFFQAMRPSHALPSAAPPILWSNEPTLQAPAQRSASLWAKVREAVVPGRVEPYRPMPLSAPAMPSPTAQGAPSAARPQPTRTDTSYSISEVMRELEAANPFNQPAAGAAAPKPERPLEEQWLGRRLGPKGRKAARAAGRWLEKQFPHTEETLEQRAGYSAAARMRLRNEFLERERLAQQRR